MGVGSIEGLAVAIAGEVFGLAVELLLVFVSARWQALEAKASKLISKREVKRIGVKNLEAFRAVRLVLQTTVFMSFSEAFELVGLGQVMKGVNRGKS